MMAKNKKFPKTETKVFSVMNDYLTTEPMKKGPRTKIVKTPLTGLVVKDVTICNGPIPCVSIGFTDGHRIDIHTNKSCPGDYQIVPPEDNPYHQKINDKEKSKGRSAGYHSMNARDQWAEDKRLGILDWDGNF